jgi:hypothetical protein
VSYDVSLRFPKPVALRHLSKTLLAIHGFREDATGVLWVCERPADACSFSVEVKTIRGGVTELTWRVRFGGSRDEAFVFAGALVEVAEKHAGEIVDPQVGGSVPVDQAFEKIVASLATATEAVKKALSAHAAKEGLVPLDERTRELSGGDRLAALVDALASENGYEEAHEELEELGADALFLALERETDAKRKRSPTCSATWAPTWTRSGRSTSRSRRSSSGFTTASFASTPRAPSSTREPRRSRRCGRPWWARRAAIAGST